METVSIITPAYKAQEFIVRSVSSVLAQTYPHWEMLIISDDMQDYQPILDKAGINDGRIRFLSTGKIASGESIVRNIGIQHANSNIIAVLDSDDAFIPTKLEKCVPMVRRYGLVSCSMEIRNDQDIILRRVANGGDSRVVKASSYKTRNCSISGDSMVLFDRKRTPVEYDPTLKCLPDLEIMLKCFESVGEIYHFTEPLHLYYKQPGSVSNNQEAHIIFSNTKKELLNRLTRQHYKFVDKDTAISMKRFLEVSLVAEQKFAEALQRDAGVIFEDIIEPLL